RSAPGRGNHGRVRGHQPPRNHGVDRQSRSGADRSHAPAHDHVAARPPDWRWRGGMSNARMPSSKSTERGATRLPDTPPKARRDKKNEGPDVRSQLRAWLESHRASLLDSV